MPAKQTLNEKVLRYTNVRKTYLRPCIIISFMSSTSFCNMYCLYFKFIDMLFVYFNNHLQELFIYFVTIKYNLINCICIRGGFEYYITLRENIPFYKTQTCNARNSLFEEGKIIVEISKGTCKANQIYFALNKIIFGNRKYIQRKKTHSYK